MQSLIESYKNTGTLHHAYVVEGDTETSYKNVCDFCEADLSFQIKANPHFIYEQYDKFLVDDARRLRELQMNKSKPGQKKIFVISFNFITDQAQNSLLKVLEEPTKGTHFFIITPSSHIFLDTIRSRVSILSSISKTENDEALKFLALTLPQRMKFISNLVQKIKDEKSSKSDAIKLIRGLEEEIHKKAMKVSKEERKDYFSKLKNINKVGDFLHDNSASIKQLLEYTAVLI
jgi:DNA polymerase III delta prime subunit